MARSAAAAAQAMSGCISLTEFEALRLRLWGRSPAQAGGMVGGGLGVGGSVGTGVGFTTATKTNT